MVQDVTQVYHAYSMPEFGHQEFEDDVDEFIKAGKGDMLPFNTADTSLEVSALKVFGLEVLSAPKAFVRAVASETRESAKRFGLLVKFPIIGTICCRISENQLDTFTEFSVNRAIIYSAKLLSFYFRQHGAPELYTAILTAALF